MKCSSQIAKRKIVRIQFKKVGRIDSRSSSTIGIDLLGSNAFKISNSQILRRISDKLNEI